MQHINIYQEPPVQKPLLLAAWPGISNVALQVADYIRKKLRAKEFAEIEPSELFTPLGVLVRDNIVEVPEFPKNKFYYWKNQEGKSDLILFIAEAQPIQKQYELTYTILDLAQRFKVRRIYTCAAALVQHHVEKSRVWAAATDAKLTKELQKYDVVLTGDFQIRGLNGLLLGAARERGMEGICLLGETPHYAAEAGNPIASYAVLQVLIEMLEVEIDLLEIAQEAKQMAEEMKTMTKDATARFIDQFTKPIWERGDSEENE